MNFKNYADYYDLFYKKKKYKLEVKKIHKLIKLKKRDKLLEVGCGTGKHTRELIKYVNEIDAVDKSVKMLNKAKKIRKFSKNKKLKFYNLDITKFNNKKKI